MGPHGLSHPAELSKSFSRSRVRVCRWHGLGHGPNDTWQARVEHNTGGEPGGNGGGEEKEKEEGKACTGRLRNHPLHPAVLSEVFYGSPAGAAAGGPVPL